MIGNSVIQLTNYMVGNADLVSSIIPVKGEISIVDAPGIKTILIEALVTCIITVTATYIGAKLGSKNTIKLYQEQEKVRIREDLKIKFYCEYEQLYKELSIKVSELKSHIGYLRFLFLSEEYNYEESSKEKEIAVTGTECIGMDTDDCIDYSEEDSQEKEIMITGINSVEDIERYLDEDFIKELGELIEETEDKINHLYRFMYMKKKISGYENFVYFDILYIVRSINSSYKSIIMLPMLYKEKDPNRSYLLDKEEIVNSYKREMSEVLNKKYKLLEEFIEDMDNIHESISEEFVGNYFKE